MRRSPRITLFIGAVVALSVLAPARPVIAAELLSDNFESGTLQQWSTTQNFTAQQSIVAAGAWAGRATTSGDSAHATATLATPQSDVYLRAFVRLVSHTGSTPLLRLRTASGKVIASLNANASNGLVLKNVVTGATLNGGVTMPSGAFVELQLHVFVSGSSGMAEVWVGGVKNAPMSGTQNFGTTDVGRVVLGRNDVAAASMDVVYDDVVVSTTFVGGGGGGTPPLTPTGLTATSTTADAVGLSWNASSRRDRLHGLPRRIPAEHVRLYVVRRRHRAAGDRRTATRSTPSTAAARPRSRAAAAGDDAARIER